jgi:DNA-directed RNA polymerase specialized sigma subunit
MRIPKPAIEGEVYTRFAQQAKNWKPEKNASLITNFKTDKGRTLSRDMRQLAQFGKAERGRVSKMERIQSVQELIELSGEEATAEKIAAETGFKLTDVRKALSESTGDLLGSKDLGIGDSGSDDVKIRMAASRVKDFYSGAQRNLVEHMFGLSGNSPVLDNNELARLTSVTPEYVSRFKKKLNERLQTEYQRM